MDKEKKQKVEVTEMFTAKVDKDRCIFGCIKKLKDDDCNPFVFSRILMPDGLLCASAPEQQELGDNLDKMCRMICDKGLHSDCGVSIEVFGNDFFLN